MLVFGESILNDAVAIVLTTTIVEVRPSTLRNLYFVNAIGFFGTKKKLGTTL